MKRRWITSQSTHPMHGSDRLFFASRPKRQFRARSYVAGDAHLPPNVTVFGDDGTGAFAETNLTVVKRIRGAIECMVFAVSKRRALNSDLKIKEFLRSRNIDPDTMERNDSERQS